MRKFLLMSALILGMTALTKTEEVSAQPQHGDTGNWGHIDIPPRPGTHPYPGGSTPWTWEPWQNPLHP